MLKIITKKIEDHPFTTVDDLHKFVDQCFHDLWKQKGRTTEAIKSGYAHRASI